MNKIMVRVSQRKQMLISKKQFLQQTLSSMNGNINYLEIREYYELTELELKKVDDELAKIDYMSDIIDECNAEENE